MALLRKVFVNILFVLLTAAVTKAQTEQEWSTNGLLESAFSFVDKCGDQDLMLCLKERALRFIDKLTGDYEVSEGVTFVQQEITDNNAATEGNSRAMPRIDVLEKLPEVGEEREQTVDNLLYDRIAKFLSTHSLELKIPDSFIGDVKSSIEESRKKKKKILLPLLLLLKLKAATLIPIVLGGLALLAFKALIVGKIALLISSIIALKKLLDTKHHSQTYEVVAHPHHTYSSTYSDDQGHYGRSLSSDSSAHNLAYSAHADANKN